MATADAKIQLVVIPSPQRWSTDARAPHGPFKGISSTNYCLPYRELLTKPRNELTYVHPFPVNKLQPRPCRPCYCAQFLLLGTRNHDGSVQSKPAKLTCYYDAVNTKFLSSKSTSSPPVLWYIIPFSLDLLQPSFDLEPRLTSRPLPYYSPSSKLPSAATPKSSFPSATGARSSRASRLSIAT